MSDKVPNFIDYQIGKTVPSKELSVAVAQDQDTVIGDAMCHAAQILYDVAVKIAKCISNNAQYAINMKDLHKAELALAYMQGVRFGLAMDDERDKAYLANMERTMASIRRSKECGFQLQIDVPPRPSEFLHFDEMHCRAMGDMFLHSLNETPPSNRFIRELEDKIPEEGHGGLTSSSPAMIGGRKVVLAINNEPANVEDAAIENKTRQVSIRRKPGTDCVQCGNDSESTKEAIIEDIYEAAAVANVKVKKLSISFIHGDDDDDGWLVRVWFREDRDCGDWVEVLNKMYDMLRSRGYNIPDVMSRDRADEDVAFRILTGISGKIAPSTDSSPEVNRLRMLLRTNRIGKEAFCGGIATLMATGIISKSEFTRLSTLAK